MTSLKRNCCWSKVSNRWRIPPSLLAFGFLLGLWGIDHVQAAQGYQFHDETTKADSALVVGKITGANHPFVEHYKFLRDLVADVDGVEAKYTIPAPAQFYFELIRDAEHVEQLNTIYPDFAAVREDINKPIFK